MGYKTERTNFRVVVEPVAPWSLMEDHVRMTCQSIIDDIRRHVDDVRDARMEWDNERTCEHCGCAWTEREDAPHNGGCCDEDAKMMEEE